MPTMSTMSLALLCPGRVTRSRRLQAPCLPPGRPFLPCPPTWPPVGLQGLLHPALSASILSIHTALPLMLKSQYGVCGGEPTSPQAVLCALCQYPTLKIISLPRRLTHMIFTLVVNNAIFFAFFTTAHTSMAFPIHLPTPARPPLHPHHHAPTTTQDSSSA
jgi:hypothetical protein